ncbi:hypothetical protein QUF73_19600 [Cytobacillus sp. NJ13]|nr:hypothetical protein [Cytobacillus sp. NJ13]
MKKINRKSKNIVNSSENVSKMGSTLSPNEKTSEVYKATLIFLSLFSNMISLAAGIRKDIENMASINFIIPGIIETYMMNKTKITVRLGIILLALSKSSFSLSYIC